MHVKKNDTVVVISGKFKGTKAKVLTALPAKNRVVLEGVNMITVHKKPRSAAQTGGRIQQEGTIAASNVMLYCETCKKGVRTDKKFLEDGTKVRVCCKCGYNFDK